MKMRNHIRKQIITFLVFTLVLSCIFYYFFFAVGKSVSLIIGMMWVPGISAIATLLLFQRNLRNMGWGWGKTKYQVISYVLPLAFCSLVYGTVWLVGLGDYSLDNFSTYATDFLLQLGLSGLPLFGISLLVKALYSIPLYGWIVLGEEIGWSGFFVPKLARVTCFFKTSVIVGLVWAVWHYPAIIFRLYGPKDILLWYAIPCFTLIMVGFSFIRTWMRLKSGSLWVGVFLHLAHNIFIQEVFDPITIDKGRTKFFTTEFGLGLAIAYCVAAYYFWKRRSALPQDGDESESVGSASAN